MKMLVASIMICFAPKELEEFRRRLTWSIFQDPCHRNTFVLKSWFYGILLSIAIAFWDGFLFYSGREHDQLCGVSFDTLKFFRPSNTD